MQQKIHQDQKASKSDGKKCFGFRRKLQQTGYGRMKRGGRVRVDLCNDTTETVQFYATSTFLSLLTYCT